MINSIFGSYIVLEQDLSKKAAAKYWKIKCQFCGEEKSIRSDYLKKNPICKCQKDTMINHFFGDFLVLNRCKEKAKDNCILYQCKCIHCGHIENVASNVLRSNRKHCSNCYIRKTTLIDMVGQEYGFLKVLSRDLSVEHTGHENDSYWLCKCMKCGSIKSIRGVSLRKGLTKSCGCVKSHGEEIISKILTENNIIFEKEYSFDNLIYKQKLRFDFAIFNNDGTLSHLVEYDGIQHFEQTNWGTLEETQFRDKIKNQYCIDNNIKLIRLSNINDITLYSIMGKEKNDTQ